MDVMLTQSGQLHAVLHRLLISQSMPTLTQEDQEADPAAEAGRQPDCPGVAAFG